MREFDFKDLNLMGSFHVSFTGRIVSLRFTVNFTVVYIFSIQQHRIGDAKLSA